MSAQKMPFSLVRIDAVIFDLDGVLTDTASAHFQSWKQTFDPLLRERAAQHGEEFEPFTMADYHTYVDGKPRFDGVRSFLVSRGISLEEGGEAKEAPGDADTVHAVGMRKNARYQEFLTRGQVERFDDALRFVDTLRQRGVALAVVSSSRNCATVLQAAGLSELFRARVDGNDLVAHNMAGKPAPDMFLEAAGRLGVAPENAVVVEDAVSGVEAGRRGHFACVVGMARTGNDEALANAGADVVIHSFDELDLRPTGGQMPTNDLPDALEEVDAIVDQLGERRLAVFLDYDGTLTPIVERPEVGRAQRRRCARRSRGWPTRARVAIVSGRDLEDVRELVGLDGSTTPAATASTSRGPTGRSMPRWRRAPRSLPALDARRGRAAQGAGRRSRACRSSASASPWPCTTASVADARRRRRSSARSTGCIGRSAGAAQDAAARRSSSCSRDIDWDKGKAVLWLLEALGLTAPDVVPLYIGDDVTDEDAFRRWPAGGVTWLCSRRPGATAAGYRLADPARGRTLLGRARTATLGAVATSEPRSFWQTARTHDDR